jgi:hypothetical protein
MFEDPPKILSGWREESCPILNGIFFPDDRVIRLDVTEDLSGGPPVVRARKPATLGQAALGEPIQWTRIGIVSETYYADLNAWVVAGGGGFGGDGFAALLKGASRDLEWLAFLDCSNPFEEVRIEGQAVFAVSNLGMEWRFPIADPEKVHVTPLSPPRRCP